MIEGALDCQDQDKAFKPCDRTNSVRRLRRIAALVVAIPALFSCCALHRTAPVPVRTILYATRPEGRARTLVVFLPGKRSRRGDFDRKRFIGMARQRGVEADLMEADLHLGYYREGTYSRRLWEDVVAPARASGYRRIWIVGISLGGSGALGFAREHPDSLAGLVLLSPYLGPPELTEKIRVRGGLEKWTPETSDAAGSFERFFEDNWSFLKRAGSAGGRSPAVFLGYGLNERMAPSLELLAESLPAGHVARVPGGHRWKTWQALWAELLSRQLFDEPKTGAASGQADDVGHLSEKESSIADLTDATPASVQRPMESIRLVAPWRWLPTAAAAAISCRYPAQRSMAYSMVTTTRAILSTVVVS